MTNEQKGQIKKLREQGYGYGTIADSVGLSRGSVISYCNRYNVVAEGKMPAPKKKINHMTDEQKDQIENLRNLGYGYGTIANSLRLPKSTVVYYCRNHGLTGKKSDNVPSDPLILNVCKCCGKPLKQRKGVKRIQFCNSECRMKWWNSHPEKVHKKAYYSFTCAYCGKEFKAYGQSNRKYCSHACYINDRFYNEQ